MIINNIIFYKIINMVLQYLSGSDLKFSVISDSVTLEQDLFLNLGNVQNLSIDLGGSVTNKNNTVALINTPAMKYKIGIPNSVFLVDLQLGRKAYPCTCSSVG